MIIELMLEEEVGIWGYSSWKKKRYGKILERSGAWRGRVYMHVIKQAANKAWDSCYGIIRAGGRHLGINPLISLKLWRTIDMEKLLYGCE